MAIIKFISEQVCKLYIDTEFVDVIEPNRLYKVEMEVGSYLIEVFTADDVLIKKYTFSIEPGQMHVLHQLCGETETLASTIQKIKEDSDICFHNNRLRFKHNGKYGFLNSRYEVEIAPDFCSADDFLLERTLVSREFQGNKKFSIIDVNGNLCYGRWYNFIGENEATILLSYEKKLITFDRGDLTPKNEYDLISSIDNNDLIPVSQKKGKDIYCGFIDRAGIIVVPLIYDSVDDFDDKGFAKVKRFGNERAVDRQGCLYYSLDEALKDGTVQERSNLFCDDSDEDRTYIYHANKLTAEESQNRDFCGNYFNEIYNDDTPVKESGKWGLMEYDPFFGEEESVDEPFKITYYHCDNILYFANGYFVYRIGDDCMVIDLGNREQIFTFRYDWVHPVFIWKHTYQGQYDERELKTVIVRKNEKYGLVRKDGKVILPTEYDKIEPTDAIIKNNTGEIGIIWKNGKSAIVNLVSGRLLTAFIYDNIKVNPYTSESISAESTFMVSQNGVYGCLNMLMQEIVPIKFDSIDYEYEELSDGYRYRMKLYLNGKVGVYEYRKYYPMNNYENIADYSFHCDTEFDECEFLNHKNSICSYASLSFVGVRKGDKWGILDAEPAEATYFPIDDSYWCSTPNFKDLDYKYKTLDELLSDTDQEFTRRSKMYHKAHIITEIGGMNIISTFFDE